MVIWLPLVLIKTEKYSVMFYESFPAKVQPPVVKKDCSYEVRNSMDIVSSREFKLNSLCDRSTFSSCMCQGVVAYVDMCMVGGNPWGFYLRQ